MLPKLQVSLYLTEPPAPDIAPPDENGGEPLILWEPGPDKPHGTRIEVDPMLTKCVTKNDTNRFISLRIAVILTYLEVSGGFVSTRGSVFVLFSNA